MRVSVACEFPLEAKTYEPNEREVGNSEISICHGFVHLQKANQQRLFRAPVLVEFRLVVWINHAIFRMVKHESDLFAISPPINRF